MAGTRNPTPKTWDASAQMDASIDALVSYHYNHQGAFDILAATTGEPEPASLYGLPNQATYPKGYQFLKQRLQREKCSLIWDLEAEIDPEHRRKLESELASLSDAQFDMLVRVLAFAPVARHGLYLIILASLPRDLGVLRDVHACRQSGATNFAHPLPWERQIARQLLFPKHITVPATADEAQQQPLSRPKSLHLTFSIDDVDGAADLLLKMALRRDAEQSYYHGNVDLLHQFALLSRTVASQLCVKWMGRWPVNWEGIDEFTLNLLTAYGPDGIFVPTKQWLQGLNRMRNATPKVFRILAPNREMETNAYGVFGVGNYESRF